MKRLAHILLVEDNEMDVTLTLDAFREAQLENTICVCRDGDEALDYLFGRGPFSDRTASPLPDLVLLDIKLPRTDGHEVLRQVKSTPGLKRIPVIMLTSSSEQSDVLASYDNAANGYIVKPVSFDGFISAVRAIEDYWFSVNVGPPGDGGR